MPEDYRVTLRLSPDLYAQLQSRGSHGQPLVAILREALIDYLTRQSGQPPRAAMADSLAAIHTRLADIEQRLGALEATAATRQPQTQARQPPRARSAARAAMADTTTPAYDATRFVLGKLCPRGHAYGTTGKTLLRLPSRNCPACTNAFKREQRAAKREGQG